MILLIIILGVYFISLIIIILNDQFETKETKVERSPEWYEAMRELDILDGTISPDLSPPKRNKEVYEHEVPDDWEKVWEFGKPFPTVAYNDTECVTIKPEKIMSIRGESQKPIMLLLDSGREVPANEVNWLKYK